MTWLRAGGGDCEAIGNGLLDQPVNAWSSLAYVVAAGWVLWWGRRAAGALRTTVWIYAIAVSLNGWGGIAYHGSATASGKWLHDVGIATTLAVMVVHDGAQARGRPAPPASWIALAVTGCAVLLAIVPGATNGLDAVLAVAVVVLEVVAARQGRRGARSQRRALVVVLAALGVGAGVKWASSSGGPVCDAQSLLQGHALWHVLTAVAMAAWAPLALGAARPAPDPGEVEPRGTRQDRSA